MTFLLKLLPKIFTDFNSAALEKPEAQRAADCHPLVRVASRVPADGNPQPVRIREADAND